METMLLTHMFALCLRLDDYATDTTLIAKDLSMSAAKCVDHLFPPFPSLTCIHQSEPALQVARLVGLRPMCCKLSY